VIIDFLQAAEAEYIESIAYYNEQRDELGLEFAIEVKRALNRIMQYPNAWTPLSANTRRCRLNRFPYAVLYQIRPESLLIVAIQNMHQNPVSWKARISGP
jgi:hypothetical protein